MTNQKSTLEASGKLLDYIRRESSGTPEGGMSVDNPVVQPAKERPSFGRRVRSRIGVVFDAGGMLLVRVASKAPHAVEKVFYAPFTSDVLVNAGARFKWAAGVLRRFAPDASSCELWGSVADVEAETCILRIPKVKPADIDTMALAAAIKELKFDQAETAFDARVCEEVAILGTPRLAMLGMRVSKSALEAFATATREAGMRFAGLSASRFSLYNLIRCGAYYVPWTTYAVLSVGQRETTVSIHKGASIVLQRSVKVGTNAMLRALARILPAQAAGGESPAGIVPQPLAGGHAVDLGLGGISLQAAENETQSWPTGALRYLVGDSLTDEDRALLVRAAGAIAERLVNHVDRTVSFFQRSDVGSNLEGILIAAPEGAAGLIRETILSQTGLVCMQMQAQKKAFVSEAAFAEAGEQIRSGRLDLLLLAWGAAASGESSPNLLMLPQDRKDLADRIRGTRLVRVASIACSVVALLVGLWAGNDWLETRHQIELRHAVQDSWSERLTPESLQKELAKLSAKASEGRRLAERRRGAAVLSQLAEIAGKRVYLSEIRLSSEKTVQSGRGAGKNVAAAVAQIVRVKGFVQGSGLEREALLADFFSHLERSAMFSNVSIQKEAAGEASTGFTAIMKVN